MISPDFNPAEEFGEGVYQLTEEPGAHTHSYHVRCPWSPDNSKIIFFRYDKSREEGALLLMDFASGETRAIGKSTRWNAHQVADQMWLGSEQKVLYRSRKVGEHLEWKIVDMDGNERPLQIPGDVGMANEKILLGHFSSERVFPNDEIRDRDKHGLIGIDPNTGEVSLLCSIQRVLENHPLRREIESYHLFTKTALLHRRLNWAAFNFVNSLWAFTGGEPKVGGYLHAFNLDTHELVFVGKLGHHPIWHPTEPWLLSFSDDERGRRRLTLDKLQEDGTFKREFLEYFSTSGHPSFDPTGSYIIIDNYSKRKGHISMDLYDFREQKTYDLFQCKRTTIGYPHAQKKRREGETVIAFMERCNYGPGRGYIVQAHPAWDRTGRYVAFNSDASGLSQVYVIDLAEPGFYKG